MSVTHFTPSNVAEWYQSQNDPIFLGDVLDASNSASMGAGFARYRKGASNDWHVWYDEVLIITKGVFSVISDEGTRTANVGEIIFLSKGTSLTYQAEEDTELVYVTYPNWVATQRLPENKDLLDTFHPAPKSSADTYASTDL